MKPIHSFLFSTLSGILLILAWPATGGLTPLLFIALVPLMWADLNHTKGKFFWYANWTFLLFNVGSTWWVWNASSFGAVAAILLNALFTTLIYLAVRFTRLQLSSKHGYIALLVYWVAWEYMHHDWDLSWPWLTLGYAFAERPEWVQWYSYTGSFGGSIWVLGANVLAFRVLKYWSSEIKHRLVSGRAISLLLWIMVPLLTSLIQYSNYQDLGEDMEVVLVQPNIDPYNEKFGGMTSLDQVRKILDLAEDQITPNTKFVVAPETAIPDALSEDKLEGSQEYQLLEAFAQRHPQISIVIGATTYHFFSENEAIPLTARTANGGAKYEVYNTAVLVRKDSIPEFYHKSKLVPGVEMMPFPGFFMHFQDLAFNLGGTTGSLGRQEVRDVFYHQDGTVVAPVICYESIYGEFVGDYVKNGAEAIFIITNDGWWGDTPGYKQHLAYARLRAVEQRRSVARSANTGISATINQRGDVIAQSQWWEPVAIRDTIKVNKEQTPYAKNGDVIARTSLLFSGLLLLMAIGRKLKER